MWVSSIRRKGRKLPKATDQSWKNRIEDENGWKYVVSNAFFPTLTFQFIAIYGNILDFLRRECRTQTPPALVTRIKVILKIKFKYIVSLPVIQLFVHHLLSCDSILSKKKTVSWSWLAPNISRRLVDFSTVAYVFWVYNCTDGTAPVQIVLLM